MFSSAIYIAVFRTVRSNARPEPGLPFRRDCRTHHNH
ncbi:hypothetical protein BRAS3843_330085 [Bradyrhizobium sp. STM 3843]|nr:hypothetical protein BRAS3843_330085 [Bradyrhizobium sp. STM 3843]